MLVTSVVYAGVVMFGGVQMPFHRPVMQQESIDMLVSDYSQATSGVSYSSDNRTIVVVEV